MDRTLLFLQTVWALDHGLQSHSKRMRARTGVTGPQRLVLKLLLSQSGIAPSELARILHFHRSTVTVILRALEKAQLVKRFPNAADGRAVILELTPRGKRVASSTTNTVEGVIRRALAKMPRRDVDTARRVLTSLAAAFG